MTFRPANLIPLALLFVAAARASTPAPVTEQYGTAPDGSVLNWIRYSPDPAIYGNGPYPVVVTIHGGGFTSNDPTSSPQQVTASQRCAANGYVALAIWYRLAPPGDTDAWKLPGQTAPAYAPLQYDDCEVAVLAARQSSFCNGQVAAMGGSAGGSHTTVLCADTHGSPTGPAWTANDRPLGGVDLSGAHEFDDWNSSSTNIGSFASIVTNFIPVSDTYPSAPSTTDLAKLIQYSPDSYITPDLRPILTVFSDNDNMPPDQQDDFTARCDSLGVTNYERVRVAGSGHAWANWDVVIPGTSETVGDRAMSWIAALFANPTPTPSPTQTPTPSPTPTPTPSPTPTPTPFNQPNSLLNISTRLQVRSGDGVLIGGFIVAGAAEKNVLIRALGPSLAGAGVPKVLGNPEVELYDSSGTLLAQNSDWTTLPPGTVPVDLQPTDPREAVINASLPAGNYTAVLRGEGGTTGVALCEVYDLSTTQSSVRNISTRGDVGLGDDVMIGGFIIGGTAPTKVIVRALGPSLTAAGISGALADPVLELHDSAGSLIFRNDNWRTDQEQEIIATTVPPTDDRESAIVATLQPGAYTAIVGGANNTAGVALVEVYALSP
jgi:acetyl esterase/lipase